MGIDKEDRKIGPQQGKRVERVLFTYARKLILLHRIYRSNKFKTNIAGRNGLKSHAMTDYFSESSYTKGNRLSPKKG